MILIRIYIATTSGSRIAKTPSTRSSPGLELPEPKLSTDARIKYPAFFENFDWIMIRKLVDKVASAIAASEEDEPGSDTRKQAIQLATAVLMIDVARADHSFDESEFERILELVRSHFDLTTEDTAELVVAAREKSDDSVSAYEFTRLLHENLDEREKAHVVSLLWQIAYADGELDKYENSFVLKISDLLHVSRGRVMRLKHDAGQTTALTGSD